MTNPKDVFKKVQEGLCVLIDVREEEEIREEGIAEGALWMPTSKMDDSEEWVEFKKGLSKNKEIYLYCHSGARSGRVAGLLAAEGFSAKNLGGFKDWKAAQLPVKKYP